MNDRLIKWSLGVALGLTIASVVVPIALGQPLQSHEFQQTLVTGLLFLGVLSASLLYKYKYE